MLKPLLPVVLISGFLGAGKTTFLRFLLAQASERGLKAGVIINEWGTANVDGAILGSSGARLIGELSGGCACCSSQDEMIWTMLEWGQKPRDEQPDFVALELSGLADPLVALDGLTVAALLPSVRVASMVSLVEAALVPELASRSDGTSALWTRQITLADQLVVSKSDLLFGGEPSAAGRAGLERTLRELNPSGTIHFAQNGSVELDSLWKRIEGDAFLERANAGDAAHENTQTLVLPMFEPMEREQLAEVFTNLQGVWRAKGFVRIVGEEGLFLAQYVGIGRKQFVLERFEARYGNALLRPELVFIGPELNEGELRKSLAGEGLVLN